MNDKNRRKSNKVLHWRGTLSIMVAAEDMLREHPDRDPNQRYAHLACSTIHFEEMVHDSLQIGS